MEKLLPPEQPAPPEPTKEEWVQAVMQLQAQVAHLESGMRHWQQIATTLSLKLMIKEGAVKQKLIVTPANAQQPFSFDHPRDLHVDIDDKFAIQTGALFGPGDENLPVCLTIRRPHGIRIMLTPMNEAQSLFRQGIVARAGLEDQGQVQ